VVVVAAAAACGGSSGSDAGTPTETETETPTETETETPTETETSTDTATGGESSGSVNGPVAIDVDFGADAADGYSAPPLLDVWAGDDLDDAPVLVVFHGIPTDRQVTRDVAAEFADRGYVVFNADWQFNSEAPSFATGGNVHAACAVRFARQHAERYGGNPDEVATLGYSAGGAVSALLGLNGNAITGQCSNDETLSAEPDRVIALAGMFEYQLLESAGITFGPMLREQDPELWATINPYEQLDQAAGVPALLIHGADDDVIPLASTERFAAALTGNGADVTTEVLPGVDHGLAFGAPLDAVADIVDAWYA
jgi:acetyl esterase/lipase